MGRILRDDAMSAEFSLKESARNDFHTEIDHVQRQGKNGFYTTVRPGKNVLQNYLANNAF